MSLCDKFLFYIYVLVVFSDAFSCRGYVTLSDRMVSELVLENMAKEWLWA